MASCGRGCGRWKGVLLWTQLARTVGHSSGKIHSVSLLRKPRVLKLHWHCLHCGDRRCRCTEGGKKGGPARQGPRAAKPYSLTVHRLLFQVLNVSPSSCLFILFERHHQWPLASSFLLSSTVATTSYQTTTSFTSWPCIRYIRPIASYQKIRDDMAKQQREPEHSSEKDPLRSHTGAGISKPAASNRRAPLPRFDEQPIAAESHFEREAAGKSFTSFTTGGYNSMLAAVPGYTPYFNYGFTHGNPVPSFVESNFPVVDPN